MSIPTAPPGSGRGLAQQPQARRLTRLAYVVQLLYIPWWLVMVAAGYLVYALFGMEPGLGEDLTSKGLIGWVVNVLFAIVLAAPSWIGALLAHRARAAGAGRSATVALAVCVILGLTLVVLFGLIWPV